MESIASVSQRRSQTRPKSRPQAVASAAGRGIPAAPVTTTATPPKPTPPPAPNVRTALDEGYSGYHLILDARGCDVAAITCRPTLDRFIRTLVRDIDMTAYGEPVIEHFATHDIAKAGYSLVQLTETSSITGHFVDKNGDVYLDVFSCKPHPIETVKARVQRFFRPKSMRVTYLMRKA